MCCAPGCAAAQTASRELGDNCLAIHSSVYATHSGCVFTARSPHTGEKINWQGRAGLPSVLDCNQPELAMRSTAVRFCEAEHNAFGYFVPSYL